MLKKIEMTIQDDLLERIEAASQQLGMDRTTFMENAFKQALKQLDIKTLERQHIAGYQTHPVEPDEFDVWQEEQVWDVEDDA